jgi:CspA family cold shock protein
MVDNKTFEAQPQTQTGKIKWFSASKGFGFITCAALDCDVLLHENELGGFARNALLPDTEIEFLIAEGNRGSKVTKILSLKLKLTSGQRTLAAELEAIPLVAARVKWYDTEKGFGFANSFRSTEDIFLHATLLNECGCRGFDTGEAISLRIERTDRGLVAVDIRPWEEVCCPQRGQ